MAAFTLTPDERRWPDNEVYRLEDFFFLQGVVGELRIWTMSLEDPHPEPGEAALLKSLGKGSSMGGPLIVDGKLWGELYATREVGARRFNDGDIAYVEALAAILSGGISRAPKTTGAVNPVYLHLNVPDCDAAFAKMVGAGATPTMPPWDAFWGDRYAQVTDPFGHQWSFSNPLPADRAKKAQESFKGM